MTTRKTGKSKPKVEELELNKETIQDLTEGETEAVEGGQVYRPRSRLGACVSSNCTKDRQRC